MGKFDIKKIVRLVGIITLAAERIEKELESFRSYSLCIISKLRTTSIPEYFELTVKPRQIPDLNKLVLSSFDLTKKYIVCISI